MLTVQVVNYNTRRHLLRCLRSVEKDLQASAIAYELNVLDNDSGDDLGDLPDRYAHCQVTRAPRNVGFGAGHNLLARGAQGEHLLILNPDVEFIQADTASRLLSRLAHADRAVAVGPRLLTSEGRPQRFDHARLKGWRAQVALRAGHSYWSEDDGGGEVAWVSGAVLLTETAAFAAVEGFDERLFLYKEEEDLCLRMRRRGGRVVFDPSIVVRHLGSVVASRDAGFEDSIDYFVAKHFKRRALQRSFEALHRRLP